SLLRNFIFEPPQPLIHNRQTLSLEAIDSFAPALLKRNQTRRFQNAQMPGRSGPRMTESTSNLACCHAAAAKLHRQQNLAARRMGQRATDRVQSGESFFCTKLRH